MGLNTVMSKLGIAEKYPNSILLSQTESKHKQTSYKPALIFTHRYLR